MIKFFKLDNLVYAVESDRKLSNEEIEKLSWLFSNAKYIDSNEIEGTFLGPRQEIITPWSTNAVEITINMGIDGINRIEEYKQVDPTEKYDDLVQQKYSNLNQDIFNTDKVAEPILYIDDIKQYNEIEGLALSDEEVKYLENLSKTLNRKLTDSEVFGFSQVNSEHCRHKIFNGTFILDGKEQPTSLFKMIKETSKQNPNFIISAYKDNVAFIKGPQIEQFAPKNSSESSCFEVTDINSVLSLKAETHNFPTTVEPFNGAATGSGGEIRDRLGGGKGSLPLAGTAVYMTSYPRIKNNVQKWEKNIPERNWLYQTPSDILIKASNGASDFGNKFGQPLICGSVLTFEHFESEKKYGFDKVIMLAGGIGYTKDTDSKKDIPEKGDAIVVLGGDNYFIGMGGGAVSSVNTGEFHNKIELNAVQRSNPEMQKRVANVIRAFVEMKDNQLIAVHDHGAGGHLNALSEMVENNGGLIYLEKLPVGDPTLSDKEILGNESQERMGLIVKQESLPLLEKIAKREKAPMYVVGEVTDDMNFVVLNRNTNKYPINLSLHDFFGNPPKTILTDKKAKKLTDSEKNTDIQFYIEDLEEHISNVLSLESVACKDWLTNKVDRSVSGKVARQQNLGCYHLPISDLGVMALDFTGTKGIATSIGHEPIAGLLDESCGSILSVCEALTNIVWANLTHKIEGISLSANWMWPAKTEGENSRLYNAVSAISKFAIDLGINIPTGKDSLSMTQQYPNGEKVYSPGTVIISACAQVDDVKKTVTQVLQNNKKSKIVYIDFSNSEFNLGGSAFAQTLNSLGDNPPTVNDPKYFVNTFNTLQFLIEQNLILSGHDISAGGLITTLLEMAFSTNKLGYNLNFDVFNEENIFRILFSEKPSVIIQVEDFDKVSEILKENNITHYLLGDITTNNTLTFNFDDETFEFQISDLRDIWNRKSYLMNKLQTKNNLASDRYMNMFEQPIEYKFVNNFTGKFKDYYINITRREPSNIKAAIVREKGINGEREMAYALYTAGFDVKDIHVTDLMNGDVTFEDVNLIVFPGGFSNSDVLGSAKGWAGAFKYNKNAKKALEDFYNRKDTLSLGICNGCQLMTELNLIYPDEPELKMAHNNSQKFESAFVSVDVQKNNSIMLSSLEGSKLGVWIAHGEGKFNFPKKEDNYNIPIKYSYSEYPGNPNGSDFDAAAICSKDGRHLAMMPHIERSLFPWQCAYYTKKEHEVTPWILAFINAYNWINENKL
ncbi:MAG: phosphoribosylformylglycinamidine synthase [Bacteroidales bacterium]|jgi:phosphoribosylformylglycinamidine synthase